MGQGHNINLDGIEDSVCFDEDFEKERIYYLRGHHQTFPLRYDAYNNEVEIKRNPKELEALHKNTAISCEISNKRLEYRKYQDRKGVLGKGYFFAIYKGISSSLFFATL